MSLTTTKTSRNRNFAPVAKIDKIKILMIDDHPSQIEGYTSILDCLMPDGIIFTPSYSFEDACETICGTDEEFDIIFLDMSMPAFDTGSVQSGDDMAEVIRKHRPDSKIVIITAHSETFMLYNVIKKVSPEGVLVKSDFHAPELQDAFRRVMNGETYYTETVREGIRQLLSRENYLDGYNRQIIMLLAQGIKTKKLPEHLHISLSAIEKRKAQLKDYFCLERGSDEQIVTEARRLGFI